MDANKVQQSSYLSSFPSVRVLLCPIQIFGYPIYPPFVSVVTKCVRLIEYVLPNLIQKTEGMAVPMQTNKFRHIVCPHLVSFHPTGL